MTLETEHASGTDSAKAPPEDALSAVEALVEDAPDAVAALSEDAPDVVEDARDAIDDGFMAEAVAEAQRARALGEVPVGAVLVHEGRVIARSHNLRESAQDPTAHAELIAVKAAAARLGTWRLSGVTAYVTLEPCPMCAGALVNARVDRVVYGASDPKAGATESLYSIGTDERLNHRFEVRSGVRAEECGQLLSTFFKAIRDGRRRPRTSPSVVVDPKKAPPPEEY